MIRLTEDELNKVRELEFKCLLEFDRICRKYEIKYFLGGGTLLGAVRHQGFIPWDDDIDVMMLPEDYDKFRDVVQSELSDEFVYQSKETDGEYHSIFDKIRLKGTVFDTNFSQQFDLISHGIFMDIFVHDYTSENKLGQKLHIFRTILGKSLVHHKWGNTPMHFYGKLKFICRLATVYKNHTSMEKLEKHQMRVVEKYDKKKTKYLYDGRGEHTRHGAFPASILEEEPIEMMFNGKMMPVPKRYDEYLTFSYDENYMTLPPEEKRVPEHDLARLDFGKY